MKRPANRRTTLLAAGTAAFAAFATPILAETTDIHGTIEYENGKAIPEGRIEVYVDEPAAEGAAQRSAAQTSVESDGKSQQVAFVLPQPAALAASVPTEVVARLEREDGWLLARGSARSGPDGNVSITLFTVMY